MRHSCGWRNGRRASETKPEAGTCIFRAYDIRGIVDKQLTCELAKLIGQALASEVLDKGEKYLFVGRDGRSHSPKIADAFARGVLSTGCNIIDLGLVGGYVYLDTAILT